MSANSLQLRKVVVQGRAPGGKGRYKDGKKARRQRNPDRVKSNARNSSIGKNDKPAAQSVDRKTRWGGITNMMRALRSWGSRRET